ncbi:hypothetical protein AC578_7811 [Pseudocercospora eumusae]|uniref:Uncharacterized protein n=1 Tax=Pseudocercospora eumusae TaxID=321146 RepID=A0A139GTS4_9PEZI|nr:hypothetical protein AC578_7811 [Pseudocercospora eumusae]
MSWNSNAKLATKHSLTLSARESLQKTLVSCVFGVREEDDVFSYRRCHVGRKVATASLRSDVFLPTLDITYVEVAVVMRAHVKGETKPKPPQRESQSRSPSHLDREKDSHHHHEHSDDESHTLAKLDLQRHQLQLCEDVVAHACWVGLELPPFRNSTTSTRWHHAIDELQAICREMRREYDRDDAAFRLHLRLSPTADAMPHTPADKHNQTQLEEEAKASKRNRMTLCTEWSGSPHAGSMIGDGRRAVREDVAVSTRLAWRVVRSRQIQSHDASRKLAAVLSLPQRVLLSLERYISGKAKKRSGLHIPMSPIGAILQSALSVQ